jgi:hypothetical protein
MQFCIERIDDSIESSSNMQKSITKRRNSIRKNYRKTSSVDLNVKRNNSVEKMSELFILNV